MTCRIRADRPGRMYVTEFVETQQAQNESEPMKLQQQKLVLTCNGQSDSISVPRGDTVSCQSSAVGGAFG